MKSACIRAGLAIATMVAAASGAGCAAAAPIQSVVEAGPYRLELDIGKTEMMYSKAEAERMKPASGEVMVSGRMAGDQAAAGMGGMAGMPGMSSGGGMPAGQALRHLELHVRSKATGKAVRDAKVSISVADASGQQAMAVPIAVMYGVTEGPEDWHYGNNVPMPPGRHVVRVSVDQQNAQFNVTIPGE